MSVVLTLSLVGNTVVDVLMGIIWNMFACDNITMIASICLFIGHVYSSKI